MHRARWFAWSLLLWPWHVEAAVGDRLGDVLTSATLRPFGLREVARRPFLGGSVTVVLKPHPLARAHEHVELQVTTGRDAQVLELELRVQRTFLDGPDRPHALDLARAVLTEAGPDELDGLTPLRSALNDDARRLPDDRTPTALASVSAAVYDRLRAGVAQTRWLRVSARTEPHGGQGDWLFLRVGALAAVQGGALGLP